MFKVFYVLRKKERQISFLHVYHHIGILVAAWISAKYFPGGQAIYVALYNTLIHCLMYVYYLFSACNPNYSKEIWWKKYVTALQIVSEKNSTTLHNLQFKRYCSQVQHCLIFISILPAVVNVNCTYPKGWMALFSVNVGFIIYLFGKFYKNTYLNNKKNK
jgi:elongation of very long chain fatty acids protein 7